MHHRDPQAVEAHDHQSARRGKWPGIAAGVEWRKNARLCVAWRRELNIVSAQTLQAERGSSCRGGHQASAYRRAGGIARGAGVAVGGDVVEAGRMASKRRGLETSWRRNKLIVSAISESLENGIE